MRQMGNNRSIGMILGLLVVVALAVFIFRSCSPGAGIPGTGGGATGSGGPGGGINNNAQGQLGRAFAARQVSQNGCPQATTNQFAATDTIYVGFTQSDIPRGTSMFARLLRDGQPLEDAKAITADRDMRTCVWFQFQPSRNSGGFEPGSYSAQLFVNGNQADAVNFTVSGSGGSSSSGGSSAGGGGSANGANLGQISTSTRVDQNGCPTDSVTDFRADEPVYVALDRSFVPAGSQMFARLLRDGQAVEDTDIITAERDMNSCVWFVFQNSQGSGGLQPGNYQAQIFLNGDRVDQAAFQVR